VSWLAGAAVGVVLLVSGALKLASPAWPEQARQLGAPRLAVPIVPVLELALGALLVVGWGVPSVQFAAAALLGAFTLLLGIRLAQGRRPPCACFGRLATRPISWWSVARNVVLMGLLLVAAT
jgi:uncharacterized membrane protein YphA (DoxX/SURF4 family)